MSRHEPHPPDWSEDEGIHRGFRDPAVPAWCRRLLGTALVNLLLLPMALLVVIGLGALLRALNDPVAARVCGWMALAVAAVWVTSLVATTVLSAVAILATPPRRRVRHRRRRPRRPRPSADSGVA